MLKIWLIGLLLLTNALMAKVGFDVGGQGVAYYQTDNDLNNDFFSKESSRGSLGLQIDVNAKVDNGFELGYEGTFLGTLGLENSIIATTRQNAQANAFNAYATTEVFLLRRMENMNIKLGRQKLSMAYSPLAFSENWNVFENSFEALVMTNQDIKDTTILASYILKSNRHNDLSKFGDLGSSLEKIESGMYLVTVANKSLENLPITASYYNLQKVAGLENGLALWLDVKSNHLPVKLAFQAGYIDPANALNQSSVFGAKASKAYDEFALSLAYSLVSDGDFSFQNFGTKGDAPFYTQMVNNQGVIALNAETIVLKTVTKLGKGDFTVQYGVTKDKSNMKNDFSELDVVYKFDVLASKLFVGYIGQKREQKSFAGEDSSHNIRIWSRYTF